MHAKNHHLLITYKKWHREKKMMNFHPMPVQCTCHDHTTACHRVISCIKPQLEGMPILQGNSIKTQEYIFAIINSYYMILGNQTLISIGNCENLWKRSRWKFSMKVILIWMIQVTRLSFCWVIFGSLSLTLPLLIKDKIEKK